MASITDVETNLWDIPLYALRLASRNYLASLLNCPKVLPSPNGLPRDWRGLAHLSGVPIGSSKDNPTMYILSAWEKDASANFGQLYDYFGEMDRWDVQEDMTEVLHEDAEEYTRRMTNENAPEKSILKDNEADRHVLTVDDVCRLNRDGQLQCYDALLLYADEDADYAMEMVEKLENNYGLKLCYKDRDLIGGLTFEHEAIMKLIAERCQRLVIIVTSSFLNSPANKFFVNFAQALGIKQRERKVIPCIYERCSLPDPLRYYFPLDYNRSSKLWNFWDKLRDSITVPNHQALPPTRATVKEVTSSQHTSVKKIEAPPSPSALSNKSETSAQLKLESSPSFQSLKPVNLSENDSPLKKFSDMHVSDKKVKGKANKFFDKIFSAKGKEMKKVKKKTALLE